MKPNAHLFVLHQENVYGFEIGRRTEAVEQISGEVSWPPQAMFRSAVPADQPCNSSSQQRTSTTGKTVEHHRIKLAVMTEQALALPVFRAAGPLSGTLHVTTLTGAARGIRTPDPSK
jgi:hypothetical protein